MRFPISGEDFAAYGEQVLADLKSWASAPEQAARGFSLVEPNYEGVRLNVRNADTTGWCLLRKSLHDPIMPLNVEVSQGSCENILNEIKDFLLQVYADCGKIKIPQAYTGSGKERGK